MINSSFKSKKTKLYSLNTRYYNKNINMKLYYKFKIILFYTFILFTEKTLEE